MNLALRKPMSLAEFLAWEERQELKYEFDGVGPVAMTGGTLAHALPEIEVEDPIAERCEGLKFDGEDAAQA